MSEEDLRIVRDYLNRVEGLREYLIKRSRDVASLCRKVVYVCIRGGDPSKLVLDLRNSFTELHNSVRDAPELLYSNLMHSIAAEYVEALQFYSIVRESRFASLKELNVHPAPYVLGLLDVIGELKRYSLELLKSNRIDESLSLLEKAEYIYDLLSTLDYVDAVLPGFRRKVDVYRKVIDDWRELLVDLRSRKELIDRLKT